MCGSHYPPVSMTIQRLCFLHLERVFDWLTMELREKAWQYFRFRQNLISHRAQDNNTYSLRHAFSLPSVWAPQPSYKWRCATTL